MLQLLKLATWQLAEKGEQLVHEGEQSDRLNVLVEGKLDVVLKGRQIYQIPAGSFVGKLNFDSENPAPVSVVAACPVRYVS
jgi:CRP-like cAMP-binding protein